MSCISSAYVNSELRESLSRHDVPPHEGKSNLTSPHPEPLDTEKYLQITVKSALTAAITLKEYQSGISI
jgi:hypothetical protein